ncbi:creatininase family protein [Limnoglobus roseus]|uniref:Creatininase n=1 Tax=Limnoglobus roseus TaxID=2598579 RepID=A0A5C1AMW0_9BACT|nr:creatininase family protein [Limnoglobus roseus]QEL19477.1 creatininase [Limnoglobus roseus]
MSRLPAILLTLAATAALFARSDVPVGRDAPRPITTHETVFVEEMTWMEVRDAIKGGKTTVIVPTGGVEQNGPYLVTGKHNFITRTVAEAIAKKLGKTLVAPVVPFVPEGDIDPPTDHMQYPGTISVRESTFERLLTDICASFRTHGFREIVMIGDSGGNQTGMEAVARRLNAKWNGKTARVHYIPEFYDEPDFDEWLEKHGILEEPEGLHDDYATSATLAAIDPTLIRAKQRQAAGKFRINGVDLAPVEKAAEWGRKIIALRAETTATAIRRELAKPR